MTLIGSNTILVVGGKILTTDDFVFKARQESIDDVIDNYGPPIIDLIVPSLLKEGERIEIIMSGNRTYKPLRAQVTGKGVTVDQVVVDNDGQVTLQCTVDEEALSELDTLDGSDLRDVVITTMGEADGSDILDDDGNLLTATTHLPGAFRVYFAEPSLTTNNLQNLQQGETYTVNIAGAKLYDKWDGSRPMASTFDTHPGMSNVSTNVTSRDAATITFTVDADAQRGDSDLSLNTYSGVSNVREDVIKVFYSAPTATRLYTTPGTSIDAASDTNPHTIDSDADNMEIEAGESFDLRLLGSRLEAIAANAAQMAFVDGSDNPYTSLSISNVSEHTPAGTGSGHHADFRVTAAADATEASGLKLQFKTLSATGLHSGEFACNISIVPAEPTVASVAMAGREGAIDGDTASIERGDEALTCTVTGKNIRGEGLGVKIMKSANGVVTDDSANFNISGITITDNQPADGTDTLQFSLSALTSAARSLDDGASTLFYFVKIDTESGSSANAPAFGVNEITVLDPNPTLEDDPTGQANHASYRKGSIANGEMFQCTISGQNFYATMDTWASNKAQWEQRALTNRGHKGAGGYTWAELDDETGIDYMDAIVASDGTITLEITVSSNSAMNEGLREVTVYTRSGEAALAGVLDILPPAATITSVSPEEQEEGTAQALTIAGADFFPAGAGVGASGEDDIPAASETAEEEGGAAEAEQAWLDESTAEIKRASKAMAGGDEEGVEESREILSALADEGAEQAYDPAQLDLIAEKIEECDAWLAENQEA